MKVRKYILLLTIAATALGSCNDDIEPTYVRQDKMDVRTYPIASLMSPYQLPDGSIVTITADNRKDESTTTTPEQASFCLVKLSTDGTIATSPSLHFTNEANETKTMTTGLDEDEDLFGIDITENGGIYFKYITSANRLSVATFESGNWIDESTTTYNRFVGCAPLNDGGYAFIYGNQPTMNIRYPDGTTTSVQLPYIYCADSEEYTVFNICGNIMILRTDQKESHDFYVYSPSGALLNYGSVNYIYDRIINIEDSSTNSMTHAYAVASDITRTTDDGSKVTYSVLTKLDTKGSIQYEKYFDYIAEINNVTEHDGKLLCTGYYIPTSYDQMKGFNDVYTSTTSTIGRIATIDAETSDSLDTNTISLEGGVIPYATIPDGNHGYYIYMSRVFSYNTRIGLNNRYTQSILIYHVDDLNKLNIE